MAIGDPGTANGWIKERFFRDGVVSNRALAAGAVTADEIAAGTITGAKLVAGTITTTQIANGTITGTDIAAGTVTSSNILDGTIVDGDIAASTITAAKLVNPPTHNPGTVAQGILRIALDVVEAETVTIGADVYEVEVVNTDSTDNTAGGLWNNTTDPLTVDLNSTDYPAIGIGGTDAMVVGRLIRIGTEMLRVTGIASNDVTFSRGASGTTPAAHADAADIFVDDGTALEVGTTIRTGLVTTLTPAAFTDALVADINAAGTETVLATGLSDNEVFVQFADGVGGTPVVGVSALATTETSVGANNVWGAATLTGGSAAGVLKLARASRVPTSGEVDLGSMRFAFDFTPSTVLVQTQVTSDGELFAHAFNVGISGGIVTLTNDGVGDFAATHTIHVLAIG